MNRRSFLRALALSPVVPSVLCEKDPYADQPEWVRESFRRQDIEMPKPVQLNALEQVQISIQIARGKGWKINFISMGQSTMNKILDDYAFLPYANCDFAKHSIMGYKIKVQTNTLGDYLLDCENVIMIYKLV